MNKNIFNSIKLTKPNRNQFDLTHDVKMSLDMGNLCPIMALECVPGDKFNISCESLLRFAPLVAPVMHRFNVTMHYFFVPNRIIWKNWEKYITSGVKGSTPPAFPVMDCNAGNYGKLSDYLGLPTPLGGETETVSAMPFAAYQACYNEYYRDQNLITSGYWNQDGEGLLDGDNSAVTELLSLRRRAWMHDYFTAALPWAQKGDPVQIPMTGDVTIKPVSTPTTGEWVKNVDHSAAGTGAISSAAGQTQIAGDNVSYDPNGSLEVVNGESTINDLRRAYRLQAWLEKNARAGTRYVENILAHFGVKSSDARLQRPEYITGVKSPVVISEVLNTAGTEDQLPQGNMAGHGVSVTSGQYGSYYCEEHGYIIGIMSVMPDAAYQQGIPKHFLKYNDRFQFFWPEFANIGEQEVLKKELYAFQAGDGEETFGYVPRYAEYKYMPSRVAGDFKTTLDFWHFGRIFGPTPPVLNQEFIECNPGKRIFAVEDETNSLYAHVLNKVVATRPMPKFGTPNF